MHFITVVLCSLPSSFEDAIEEVPSPNQLHDEIDGALGLEDVLQLHDTGVLDRTQHLRLLHQLLGGQTRRQPKTPRLDHLFAQ